MWTTIIALVVVALIGFIIGHGIGRTSGIVVAHNSQYEFIKNQNVRILAKHDSLYELTTSSYGSIIDNLEAFSCINPECKRRNCVNEAQVKRLKKIAEACHPQSPVNLKTACNEPADSVAGDE